MNKINTSKAIEVIKDLNYRLAKDGITRQANDMAIQALEEKQQREQEICQYCNSILHIKNTIGTLEFADWSIADSSDLCLSVVRGIKTNIPHLCAEGG